MSAAEKTTDEAGELSWDLSFSAVELKESASLGGDVRIEIAPRTTVLVGKNGAGKSLLLEKINVALWGALGASKGTVPDPALFACDVDMRPPRTPDATSKLRYECHWRSILEERENHPTPALPIATEVDLEVDESCRIFGADSKLQWRVEDGVVTYDNAEREDIGAARTLLQWTISRRGSGAFSRLTNAIPLRQLFASVIRIPAGIPRSDGEREVLVLPYPQAFRGRDAIETRRIRWLFYRLVDWHEKDRPRFDEFVELGRRIGLLNEVKIKLYRDPDVSTAAHGRDLVSVLFDGTDLGLLSDGTLRVVEILHWLILPYVKLLLIEEPESAIHPGLLAKLLAEIDAYSTDRQIVLTTQSPQVVSWADPRALRLVERHAGKTSVRSLREDEISRVTAYLNDEGTLGDFVYSGALDG
jgi:hypothetical protein